MYTILSFCINNALDLNMLTCLSVVICFCHHQETMEMAMVTREEVATETTLEIRDGTRVVEGVLPATITVADIVTKVKYWQRIDSIAIIHIFLQTEDCNCKVW